MVFTGCQQKSVADILYHMIPCDLVIDNTQGASITLCVDPTKDPHWRLVSAKIPSSDGTSTIVMNLR